MDRRAFIGSLALGALAVPRPGAAQPRRKPARIGILSFAGPTSELVGPDAARPSVKALLQGLGDSVNDGSPFAALGGKREGIDAGPGRCPLPCTGTIVDPGMDATRHHELTRIALTAFFDAHLKGDAGARCAIAKGIDADQGDMTVRSR